MWPDAVVALGSNRSQPPSGAPIWFTEGTGFFYGVLVRDDTDITKRQYEVYVVTNRHVIEEHRRNSSSPTIGIRLNSLQVGDQAREFDVSIDSWFFHPNPQIDVAALSINDGQLRNQGLQNVFFANDITVANREKLASLGVSAGDGIFVLGFPMNLAGSQRNFVIARQGSIARIRDMLENASSEYLIDAFILPGNSGSPVILRPEITSIQDTKRQVSAYLVGIVRAYLPYDDVAVSQQTGRPRVSFEENSGLAEVLPTDYIDEAIAAWRTSQTKH